MAFWRRFRNNRSNFFRKIDNRQLRRENETWKADFKFEIWKLRPAPTSQFTGARQLYDQFTRSQNCGKTASSQRQVLQDLFEQFCTSQHQNLGGIFGKFHFYGIERYILLTFIYLTAYSNPVMRVDVKEKYF